GYASQHQAGIAYDREQHLAKRFGLPGIETARRRPVAGEPEFPEALQGEGYICRRAADDAGQHLWLEFLTADDRTDPHGRSQLDVLRKGAHDLSRFRADGQVTVGLR